MSDRQPETRKALKIILCDSESGSEAIRSSGFKSVRTVAHEEAVCEIVDRECVTDRTFTFFDQIVLAMSDHDLRDRVAMRLGDERCTWVDWQAVDTRSQDAIIRAIIDSKPMWTDEVCLMSDVPDGGSQQVFTTGFPLLDDHGFRLVRPAFMPVIGPYGSGKSVLMRQLCCNLFRLHGWRTLITSFEEKIKPRYQRDLRRHLIGEETYDSQGVLTWHRKNERNWTSDDVAKADALIEGGFRFLRRKRGAMLDAERLVDRIEFAVRVYGVDVVVIDPVNEIDHQVARGESKTDYMGRFIMRLKQLADDYGLLMIVCAHPPKEGVEKRASKGRLMTLNDGADTAHYGNKADIGWCVWRPGLTDNSPTYLHVDKLKDHDVMGKPTLAKLVLNSLDGAFVVQAVGYETLAHELAGA